MSDKKKPEPSIEELCENDINMAYNVGVDRIKRAMKPFMIASPVADERFYFASRQLWAMLRPHLDGRVTTQVKPRGASINPFDEPDDADRSVADTPLDDALGRPVMPDTMGGLSYNVFRYQAARKISYIAIHCSYTRPDQHCDVAEIRRWHVEDNGWSDVGYHFVIRRDGVIEVGRPIEQRGAHVRGFNSKSIGVCLVGGMSSVSEKPECNYTAEQWSSLRAVVEQLLLSYPKADVLGHRDFPNVKKACPCFDVEQWLSEQGIEDTDTVFG